MSNIDPSFYYYKGSLTTPPCTETVNWIVMREIQYMSKSQLVNFHNLWASLTPANVTNRNVQPLNGRPVYISNLIRQGAGSYLTFALWSVFAVLLAFM